MSVVSEQLDDRPYRVGMSRATTAGFVLLGLLLLFAGTAAAQPSRHLATGLPTTASSRYVIVGGGAVLRIGNTVYVAGVSRVAPATGSAVVVSGASGRAEPVKAHVAGGSVQAAIADGAGGWYIGGSFTSVGGVGRPGLAHLLSDGTLDTVFDPPELAQVKALALDAGRLYIGGIRALEDTPWFQPVLSALDAATGAVLPVAYPPLARTDDSVAFGVVALAAGDGRLFAAFNGDNGVAAYDEGSGALLWSQAGQPSYGEYGGPVALALAGGKVLVGGEISTHNGAVDLEELDPATGGLLGQPAVGSPVTAIATVAGTAYVLASRHSGPGSGVWKLDLSSGALTRLASFNFGCALATDGATVYLANWATGRPPTRRDLRVYALKLGQAKPRIRALSQVPVSGSVNALALQGGRLLVGGSFLGMGGIERRGLAAFNARTGSLLPWRPAVQGGRVAALAGSGKTIYLGGAFKRVAGQRRNGLAAVSALGKGKLLPWHPRLFQASFGSVAVAGGRVFAGGSARPFGAKPSSPFKHLLAFSATTGRLVRFGPRLGHVLQLAVGNGLLIAENSCRQDGRAYACVTAFRVGGKGRAVWRQAIKGSVSALQTDGSALYVGGGFSVVGGQPRANLAALALDGSGTVLDFAPDVPVPVNALARTDDGLVFGANTFGTASRGPYFVGSQALGAVSADGKVLPWRINFPPNDVMLTPRFDTIGGAANAAVVRIVSAPGGLVVSGQFSWIGPRDEPAPGSLVWLR